MNKGEAEEIKVLVPGPSPEEVENLFLGGEHPVFRVGHSCDQPPDAPPSPSNSRGRLTAIAGVLFLLIGEEVIQGILGGITFLLLLEGKKQHVWAKIASAASSRPL